MHPNGVVRVALACGGTGGHMYPGLAVAEVLRRRGHEVTLWLGARAVESVSCADWTGRTEVVRASGLSAGRPWTALPALVRFLRSWVTCRRILRRERPAVLLAMGSYASVGPALAARSLGIPLILHEANVIPGRAVAFLSRWADIVAVSFEATAASLSGRRCVCTGFPLRSAMVPAGRDGMAADGGRTLLVMGGSLGARAINETVVAAIGGWPGRAAWRVIHLTGPSDEERVRARYAAAGVRADVHGFLREIAAAYAAADFAISRAGAASCAELRRMAVPALLVPLPGAVRDHQSANARAMQAQGGVDVMRQAEFTPAACRAYLETLRADPGKLAGMRAAAAAARSEPDAAGRLADLVEQAARGAPVLRSPGA